MTTPRFRLLCLALFSVASAASPSAAQNPDTLNIKIYHGAPSRVVRMMDEAGRFETRDGSSMHIRRPIGSAVCLTLLNPNPVIFAYSVTATVDTSFSRLSLEVSTMLNFLRELSSAATSKDAAGAEVPDQVKKLLAAVELITKDVDALAKVTATDEAAKPGILSEKDAIVSDHGLLVALTSIKGMSNGEGRLRNANVTDYLDKLLAEALLSVEGAKAAVLAQREAKDAKSKELLEESDQLKRDANSAAISKVTKAKNASRIREIDVRRNLLGVEKDALDARMEKYDVWKNLLTTLVHDAKQSIAASRATFDTYEKASVNYRECSPVRDGRNSCTLKIGTKNDIKTNPRSNDPVQLTVDGIFQRPLVEAFPASFIVRSDDLRTYAIRGDTLQLETEKDKLQPRLGGMMTFTLFDRFEELRQLALSAGIGTNVVGGDGAVKDVMLLGTLSYRDVFRFGLGWGRVPTKKLKSAYAVGLPVPAGSKIDDLFDNDHAWDVAIMFSVSGAKIGMGKTP
jgi:hypothetical protein